jgi:hypothetical protein
MVSALLYRQWIIGRVVVLMQIGKLTLLGTLMRAKLRKGKNGESIHHGTVSCPGPLGLSIPRDYEYNLSLLFVSWRACMVRIWSASELRIKSEFSKLYILYCP